MMKIELLYLTYVTVFTAILWVPYVLDRVIIRGLLSAVGYPVDPKPQSDWSRRLMKAHANAVENLLVFATLVLVANAQGLTNTNTAIACMAYFFARIIHALAYTFAIPWIRTLAFIAGFAAQLTIAGQLLLS